MTSISVTQPAAFAERLLLSFCRKPNEPERLAGTLRTHEGNALDFLMMAVPSFAGMVSRATRVLDFGCGHGVQARVLATQFPGTEVVGVDLPRPTLKDSWASKPSLPNLRLTSEPLAEEEFDVVYSCSSFEHFDDPAMILAMMKRHVRPGGFVVIAFAEPWMSPRGSHMDGFCPLPWVNLLFSEQTVMRVRSLFRSDGATRYRDVEGGLNQMTVGRFEHLMQESGMIVRDLRLIPVKGLPGVTSLPGLRELLTASCSCVLEKPAAS